MKARIPVPYLSLPKKDKELVNNVAKDMAMKILDEQEVSLFAQYTKIACIVLHDYFGFGESRLYKFIGSFKNIQRKHRTANDFKEVNAVLDAEMERIFKKDGFPQDFVENLQRKGQEKNECKQ